jgi:hypothetical protein
MTYNTQCKGNAMQTDVIFYCLGKNDKKNHTDAIIFPQFFNPKLVESKNAELGDTAAVCSCSYHSIEY